MSSIIDSYEYDAQSETFTVTFTTGITYIFHQVPPAVVKKVTEEGKSLGSLFYKHIRKHGYEFTKLEGEALTNRAPASDARAPRHLPA